jgi:hypothetical protein
VNDVNTKTGAQTAFLAVGWSPVWLLAGASDLVGG